MEKGQKTAQLSQPLCTTLFWKLFSPPVAPISMPLGESFRLGSERTWKGNFSVGPVANPIKISLFSSRRRGGSVGTGMSKCLFWGMRSSCGLWRARQTGGGGGVWRSLFPVWVGLRRRQCEGRTKRTWWWTGRTWGGKRRICRDTSVFQHRHQFRARASEGREVFRGAGRGWQLQVELGWDSETVVTGKMLVHSQKVALIFPAIMTSMLLRKPALFSNDLRPINAHVSGALQWVWQMCTPFV